jgi:hypothetical protein
MHYTDPQPMGVFFMSGWLVSIVCVCIFFGESERYGGHESVRVERSYSGIDNKVLTENYLERSGRFCFVVVVVVVVAMFFKP